MFIKLKIMYTKEQMEKYNIKGGNNICIGKYAGIGITTESNLLILRSENINISEVMTDREYRLIKSTIDCLLETFK